MVNTDISVLRFYENIGEILVDILTKISMMQKLFKIHNNAWKNSKKQNDKISK